VNPREELFDGATRLDFESGEAEKFTHYLFKFPAKFHPPVVRRLIDRYTKPGDIILDPFCGSGTLLVEAAVSGRSAVGIDVDPLAVFITKVKTHRFRAGSLRTDAEKIVTDVREFSRPEREYVDLQFNDITPEALARVVKDEALWVPEIPNLLHWFRRYVVMDLGRLLGYLRRAKISETHREFFLLCFAAIIRAASNADPVPVSGLEVTAHMKRRDEAGRIINPFELFEKAVRRSLVAVKAYQEKADPAVRLKAIQADSTVLGGRLKKQVDAVITSPPYHIAVNYYRRHQLEMFWLGFTKTQEDRLALLPKYIGRDKIGKAHPFIAKGEINTPLVKAWEEHIRQVSPERAVAFKHYTVAMAKVFHEISTVLKPDGHALFVVGHSSWNGQEIPTGKLFVELAGTAMLLKEQFWYPVSNRYMSYSRHNGASIDREFVLVFQKPSR